MFYHALIARLPLPLRERLQAHQTLLSSAENAGWILINRAIRLVAGLVVGIWVARYLGPADFGRFNFALAYAGLFVVVVPLGLNQLNVRNLAVDPDKEGMIVGSSLGLQFMAALLMLVASLVIAYFTQSGDPLIMQLVSITSLMTLLRPVTTLQNWYQAKHLAVMLTIAGIISIGSMMIMRIVLLVNQAPVQAFAAVVILEQGVNALVILYLYTRKGGSIQMWRFDFHYAKETLLAGFPYLLNALAMAAYMRGSQIMVKELAGPVENGYFAAAIRMFELWLLIPNAIASSAMPVISKARQQHLARYERQIVWLLRMNTGMGLLTAIGTGIVAGPLIFWLYGPDYAPTAGILIVLMLQAVPYALQVGIGTWIVNEDLAYILLQKSVTLTLLTLTLNFWFIPRYQGLGAAFSVLIASVVANILWDFVDPRLRTLNRLKLQAWLPWLNRWKV